MMERNRIKKSEMKKSDIIKLDAPSRHRSTKLEKFLDCYVEIVMFDNSVEKGTLKRSEYNFGYRLIREGKGDLHFYKSHIKKIKIIE